MKKLISLILALLLLGSMSVGTWADYKTTVNYATGKSSAYTVTVPATIVLSADAAATKTVSVSGNWASNETLTVACDPTVTLTNSILSSDTKTLAVTFGEATGEDGGDPIVGITKTGSSTAAVAGTEDDAKATLSIPKIENALFGTWEGTLTFTVTCKSEIKFFIVATTYTVTEGTTWEEFLSGGDIVGWVIGPGGVIQTDAGPVLAGSRKGPQVMKDDVIVNNQRYAPSIGWD